MADIDAITLIEQDHARIRKMFEELAAEQDADAKTALFADIATQIQAHSQMELQVLYPAVRDAVGGPEAELLFYRSNIEHELVEQVIEHAQGEEPSSPKFLANLEVIRENLEHHMKVEEEVLLPRAREALRSEQMPKLLEQMEHVKEERIQEVAKELGAEAGEVHAPGA